MIKKNVENNRFKVYMECARLTFLIATVDRKLTNIPWPLCCATQVIILSILLIIVLVHIYTIPITSRFSLSPRKICLRCALVT